MLMGNESEGIIQATGGTGVDAEGNAVVDPRLKAFLETLNTQKVSHVRLVTQGICSHCGHCHQPLTDSVSVERGIGPTCSKKGYFEDPKDGDGTDAMLALAEYPQLVEFLLAHNKPDNLRGLMNALVKVCALNMGNANLHAACCDAIEALGWRKLANAMRESISCMVIKASKENPGCYEVYVKRGHWTWAWDRDALRIPGATKQNNPTKHIRIPIHAKDDPKRPFGGIFDGKKMSNKGALWSLMVKHFAGRCAKTPNGGVKILAGNGPKSEPPPAQ